MPLRERKADKLPSNAHRRAPKQERECAARLGATVTPRSGAGDVKGDVRKKGYSRIECKTTLHQSFAITRELVRKIEEAALASGELPGVEIEFLHPDGKRDCAVAVVPLYVLEMMGVRNAS